MWCYNSWFYFWTTDVENKNHAANVLLVVFRMWMFVTYSKRSIWSCDEIQILHTLQIKCFYVSVQIPCSCYSCVVFCTEPLMYPNNGTSQTVCKTTQCFDVKLLELYASKMPISLNHSFFIYCFGFFIQISYLHLLSERKDIWKMHKKISYCESLNNLTNDFQTLMCLQLL